LEFKQEILKTLENKQIQPMNLAEWIEYLGIHEIEKIKALEQTFQTLEKQLVLVSTKKQRYMLAEDAGIKIGKLSIHPKGFGFVSVEVGDDVFIPPELMNTAMHQDEVAIRVNQRQDGSVDGEVIKVIKRFTHQILGVIRVIKNKTVFIPQDARLGTDVRFTSSKALRLVEGHVVLAKILSYSSPMRVEGMQILGHINDPGVDILSVLIEKDIDPVFPKEVLKQAQDINQEVKLTDGRKDLTSQLIITIDGADAKDLDDAISIEKIDQGYRLGVHIADVSYYVTENSPLDIEAYHRGTSVYVVDRVVPMLPHVLSNGICSLNPDVNRYTQSCVMDINLQGEITDYQLFQSVIQSKYRMTYTKVNEIIEKDPQALNEYPEIIDMVKLMLQCSHIIRQRRQALGSIDFEMDEAKILIDEEGQITDIVKRERGEAERIIEDFMVSANECVAKHTRWSHIPSLYRVHENPSKKKLQAFSKILGILGYRLKGSLEDIKPQVLQKVLHHFNDNEKFPVVSRLLLRSMQKARYDVNAIGHFGLALEDYSHFTSPIRRYPDLIVHRMLRKYVFNGYDVTHLAEDEAKLKNIAEQSSFKERNAIDAEREIEDLKKAEYMEKRIGSIHQGVISGVTKFGFFVELPNTIEGLVHIQTLQDDYYDFDAAFLQLVGRNSKNIYSLGQKVKVKVKAANKALRTIDFVLIQTRNKRK